MKWGIIGAMDAEVAMLKERLEGCVTHQEKFIAFHEGTLGGQPVVVTCCGVGTINAAACTQMLIDRFGVDCIVNTGIAGALDSRLGILDVVLSTSVVFHDTDAETLSHYLPYRTEFEADAGLRALAEETVRRMGIPCYQGRIASGDVFVNSGALKASIMERFRPLCVEMEGAAIGQVAYLNGVPFLVLRTMSDNADDDSPQTYDHFWEEAADHSARIVISMIESGASAHP